MHTTRSQCECYSCVTIFCVTSLDFLCFLFAVKVGVVFQFLARPFISRRHEELCASCFLVSFFSSHRRSGIDM